MDHGYFKDRISAYYDNNLKPEEQVVIEEHLKECEKCRKLLAEFEKLDRLVEEHSQLGGEKYWEESAKKIEKSLGFEEKTAITEVASSRWFGLTWKLAAVAASVVLLTIVGLHRDEIWKEEKPEKRLKSVPSVVTPTDSVAEIITDELKHARPAEVDEDLADREVQKIEKPKPVGRSGEVVSEEAKIPGIGTSAVTPKKGEPADVGKAPSPAVVERSRDDVAARAKKDLPEPDVVEPIVSDNRLQEAVEKAEEQADLYKSITPEKETEPESLAELREQKDSLTRLMVAEGRWKDKSDLAQSFDGKESKKKVKRTPADIENDLLQTCYKIALLTEDKEEYKSVREIIEKVARDEASPNRELAQSYLRQLSEQN